MSYVTLYKQCSNQNTDQSADYAYAYSWLTYGVILWGNGTDVQDLLKSLELWRIYLE